MTYEDIKQRVFDILGYDTDECNRLGYTSKIPRILNECLFRIANSIWPYLREYKLKFSADKLPARITMPPDFLSFADEQDAYLNGKNFILTNFIGDDGIILNGDETKDFGVSYEFNACNLHTDCENKVLRELDYTIFYNAHYPTIIDGGINYQAVLFDEPSLNKENWVVKSIPLKGGDGYMPFKIPQHIAHAVPHYIAGQLLAADDKTRSVIELNEFENMLAQIDLGRHERQREYRSSRGWY